MADWPSTPRFLDRLGRVLLLVLAAASSMPTARAEEPAAPMKLTLVWMDPEGLLRFGFQAMADEVTEAFEDVGVGVTWRTNAVTAEENPLEIVVFLRRSLPTEWRLSDHAMGAGFKAHERRRVVFVFFANVLSTLRIRYEKPRMPTASETMLLAQALARVVSHEVVHSIAPEAPHTDHGLMQSQLTGESLRRSRLRLSDASVRALRSALGEIDDARAPNSCHRW